MEQEVVTYTEVIAQLKQENGVLYSKLFQQVVLNIMAHSENPSALRGELYNEKLMLPRHQQANDRFAIFVLCFQKLLLNDLFQYYSQAIENTDYA